MVLVKLDNFFNCRIGKQKNSNNSSAAKILVKCTYHQLVKYLKRENARHKTGNDKKTLIRYVRDEMLQGKSTYN